MPIVSLFKNALSEFMDDDLFSFGAALAFYTVLSLSPLLIIVVSLTSFIGFEAQQTIVDKIGMFIGPRASDVVEIVLENAYVKKFAGTVSAAAGVAVLLFSATTVFVQLQKAMNRIWNVRVVKGGRIRNFLWRRVVSLGIVATIGIVMFTSVVVNALIEILMGDIVGIEVINTIVSFAVYMFLFALLFKYVPDVELEWRDVRMGALITAVFFIAGRYLIGKYMVMSGIGSAYGAAGSLVVLLLWVYYSTLIVYFGAVVTHIYTLRFGSKISPKSRADWIDRSKVEKHT